MVHQPERKSAVRDRIFWTGTLVSILVAVVMPLLSQPEWLVALSAAASLTLSTVLSLYAGQRAFELQFESKMEHVTGTLGAIVAADRLKASLEKIRDHRPATFHLVAESSLRILEAHFQEASNGKLQVPDEERQSVPILLAKGIRASLDTTAFFENDPTTTEYHDILAEAVRDSGRKVRIRRLFIIKPGTEKAEAFKQRASKDLTAGIEVRYRQIEKWIPSKIAPEPVDFGIWDHELVWVYTDNPEIGRERMHPWMLHGDAVPLYTKAFEQNWERASPPPS